MLKMERLITEIQESEILSAQKKFLETVGLWSTPALSEKYKYRLSPDVLELTQKEKAELEEIAFLIYAPGGFIDGSIKLLAKTSSPQFRATKTGGAVWRALTAGIGKVEIPIQMIGEMRPFVCRLDLLKASQNGDGPFFQIAELEGDKTHGFGYLTIMDFFRKSFMNRSDTPGIISALSQELERRGTPQEAPIGLIVGLKERFYIEELRIFAKFAQEAGINLITTLESDARVTEGGLFLPSVAIPITTLVNLPSLDFGWGGIKAQGLLDLYRQGKIDCLIPPKRFLGSKDLLALVSNGDNDQELEKVLNQVFDSNILLRLREFIPQTILVTKRNKKYILSILQEEPENWVVKQTLSSGMKGVALPDDAEKRAKFIKDALANPYNFIIQKKVDQQTKTFKFSEPEMTSQLETANMYLRIELFASPSGIATVGVTARETPSVHGAKDAIQIPVIYEK